MLFTKNKKLWPIENKTIKCTIMQSQSLQWLQHLDYIVVLRYSKIKGR